MNVYKYFSRKSHICEPTREYLRNEKRESQKLQTLTLILNLVTHFSNYCGVASEI